MKFTSRDQLFYVRRLCSQYVHQSMQSCAKTRHLPKNGSVTMDVNLDLLNSLSGLKTTGLRAPMVNELYCATFFKSAKRFDLVNISAH